MLESLANLVITIIDSFGYIGIILTMAIESALVPLPSEVIMPFSGYLASQGHFNLWLVTLAGALGNTLGSLGCYWFGYWGHEKVARRFVRNYGKYLLISEHELDYTERLMNKYKGRIVFGARVIPGIRTIISLPAGIAKLPLGEFTVLTFLGSFIWSGFLAYIGFTLGNNWKSLEYYFRPFERLVIGLIIAGLVYYIYVKWRRNL